MPDMSLALFDLDGTLLSADSDTLWCGFLVAQGLLDADMERRSANMAHAYAAGTVVPVDYARFQAQLLRGLTPQQLLPLQQRFLVERVRPLIPPAARRLLQQHRDAGDTLVLTTATSRVVSELTARDLGVDAHLCTELELQGGHYTGDLRGRVNMRTGKVDNLRDWLAAQGLPDSLLRRASFYTDSINDLALLSVAARPVVVDPDMRLCVTAMRKGWTVLRLREADVQHDSAAALA